MDAMKEFPASLIPGKIYLCYSDFCREGLQFCNADIRERRCEFCDAYFHDCFTYQQQPNCTQYCMDQWIQNSRFNIAEMETKNDKYKIALFTLIGLWVAISVIITVCFCIPCVREWICSQIRKLFKLRGTRNQSRRLTCGHLITTAAPIPSTVPGGPHHSPLNTASEASVINSVIYVPLPAVAQRNLPNNHRLEAEGMSHHGQLEREEVNTPRRPSERAVASTSNALREDPVLPAQRLIKSKMNPSAAATKPKFDNRVKSRDEENKPFLKGASNGTIRGKSFNDDSVTYAKNLIHSHSDDNDRNCSPHRELLSVHSNGYIALPPVYSRSVDTGYHSAPAGQRSFND